ncbi:MAG TPA: hypothetical protein VF941_09180 [Clostridia bacterium]
MLSTREKSELITESLAKTIDNHLLDLEKLKAKKMKSVKSREDFENSYNNLLIEMMEKTHLIMKEWENKSLPELQDLTPLQYFNNLESLEDIIEILTFIEAKNWDLLPHGLSEKIKRLDDSSIDNLLTKMQSMTLDESKSLNPTQKAMIRIAVIIGSPRFLAPIENLICQLEEEKSDEDTYKLLMYSIKAVGEQALEWLMQLAESNAGKKKLYINLVIAIADIASKNKSEEVYKFLKDRFRKSSEKEIEAAALSVYGDGRAIPAIRGYVERNLGKLPYLKYHYIKDAVIKLGGDISDLDEYFTNYGSSNEGED